MLPSKEALRQSIIRSLTAVSDDICSAFERTVDGYKTELDRQRRLIDVVWNPNIRLHVSDLQLLCDDLLVPAQRRPPGPGPGPSREREPGPGPSREREPGPGPSQEREPGPGPGPSRVREPGPGPSREREPGPGPGLSREREPGPGPSREREPGSPQNHGCVEDPAEPERHTDPGTGKSCVECHVCGKSFKLTFQLKRHLRFHADKPYGCHT
ncbi:zinc finger protein 219-like isoform X2 [Salarias fasciatus]|uniref:zinc finger protein 219-like isoform X2 n=1 Tax=Salarias fasciatus TaxID=181472 RepID=UPI001176D713|nr:zinc finger protein 219-like isoform X2 [Salarias fasciatus]